MGKNFETLKLSDDFLFCKVMTKRPDLCKILLEVILDTEITNLELVNMQTSLEITPDTHGIRLDVYTKDESNTSYDVEMQTTDSLYLPQRSRYYHSILDIGELEKGKDYSQLRPSYVIFICTFDPFKKNLPIYRFENSCLEDPSFKLNDGTIKLFLNVTASTNNQPLQEFFDYVRQERITSTFTQQLHNEVLFGRQNGEWRREYMRNEARYMDALIAGREQGVAQEQKNTEQERQRAEQEKLRADIKEAQLQEAEATIATLQQKLNELTNK